MTDLADELRGQKYAAIVADPPWNFRTWSTTRQTRAAANHYRIMSLADIIALPVASIAADDCVLFLWATDPLLPAAFDVLKAWGFTYKTVGFYWAKTAGNGFGSAAETTTWPIGTGYWTRANPEQCLLATRGKPKRINADVRRLIVSPRRQHSRKPDEVYERIERLVPGPYLDLFSRQQRLYWTSWGDQSDMFAAPACGARAALPLLPETAE